MDTLQIVKELAAKQFGGDPEAVDENAPVDQLGIDSLGFLEFLFELEDKFGISIPQDSVATVKTLAELTTVINELIASSHSTPA
jgi:acyl carrier protein